MAPGTLKSGRFSLMARLRSFRFALAGLRHMLVRQQNAQVHLAITIIVCAAGAGVGLNTTEWAWIVVAFALVWIAEAVNTAFEYLCDVVEPEFHHGVEKAKDIAAGSVLIAAVASVLLGCFVFWPHLF
jgi:diacylglycerol kinase (ATP)